MIAIVPARGGSKGLPGKNTRKLAGVPLIAHSIQAALSSKHIKDVIVSTDSQEIYDTGISYGASSFELRPSHLATDDSQAIDTYLYTIERLVSERGIKLQQVVILQPTSPLRTSEDIDSAIDLFHSKNADSVISYTEEVHPISWHKYLRADLTLEPIFSETFANRQELKKSYYPNGAIYVFNVDLLKSRKYTSERTYAYLMPRCRSVDIDTIEDFEYASFLMKEKR